MGFLVLILRPLNDFMKFELPSVGTYFTNDASAEPRNSLFLSWEVGAGGVIFIIFTDNLYDLEFSSQKGLKLLIFNSHLPIIHLLTACWLVAKNELGETEKRLGRENMQNSRWRLFKNP